MTADEALACLGRAFAAGRLAQGYILVAPPRDEGAEVALRLAQMVFCTAGGGEACGECRACRQAVQRAYPDLFWVEPAKRSRIISIEQVRELCGSVARTAYAGGWKVCVLAGADRLGEAAASAFLKTLEEPPPRTLFLLLTDSPAFLLPTIRSRCQLVTISTAQSGLPDTWREQVLAALAASQAGRDVIQCMGLAEKVGRLLRDMKDTARAAEDELAEEEAAEQNETTVDARANARYRELRTALMRTLLGWYRDELLVAAGGDRGGMQFAAYADAIAAGAAGVTVGEALRHVAVVEDMNRQLERNLPETAVLYDGFARLAG